MLAGFALRGNENGSSDLFSLGVVMYEMATGRRPFQGDTEAVAMSSILRGAVRPKAKGEELPVSAF